MLALDFDDGAGSFGLVGSKIAVRPAVQKHAGEVIFGVIETGALKGMALPVVGALRSAVSAGAIHGDIAAGRRVDEDDIQFAGVFYDCERCSDVTQPGSTLEVNDDFGRRKCDALRRKRFRHAAERPDCCDGECALKEMAAREFGHVVILSLWGKARTGLLGFFVSSRKAAPSR